MGPPTDRDQPTPPWILAVLAVLVIALAGVVSRPAHAAATANVTVKNYSFSEPDLVIDPGTEVTWTATQGDHTVTSNGGSFDEMIAQDYNPHSFSYTFTNPGRYSYYCGFHRAKGMEAVVEVRDPSGGPTTTEPPTTTTTWSPPTTTTSAPATTTSAPPVTATTSTPTVTTAPLVPVSTAPATVPPSPATTAPPATDRPTQAGAAKTAVAAPPATTAPAAAPTTTAPPPPSEVAPAGDATASPDVQAVAAPAPEVRRQAGEATSSPAGAGDGNGPALGLLLGAAGVIALAGGGAAVWRWRRH